MNSFQGSNFERFRTFYFKKFQKLFVDEFGFFFGENRLESFYTTLTNYLTVSPCDDWDEFHEHLSTTMAGRVLFKQIMDDVTIGETYFFRNEPQLDLLKETIIPLILKRKRLEGNNSIKIWSAGCSTGEEVYTLSMILQETLPVASMWNIEIAGTDVNREVLKVAEKGVYKGTRPIRHLPVEIRDKYFEQDGSTLIAKDIIKSPCSFYRHNLVKDAPPLTKPDLIFCRNVLIYFNSYTTANILEKFYNNLCDLGFLFLGHSETIWQLNNEFKTLDFPKGFVYQKDPSFQTAATPAMPAIIPEIDLNIMEKAAKGFLKGGGMYDDEDDLRSFKREGMSLEAILNQDVLFNEGVVFFEQKKYNEAIECFDKILEKDDGYIMAYFAKSTIYSNSGRYKEALEVLERLIKIDNLFSEAWYLKAILHVKLGNVSDAIDAFQRVLFISPDHALSHFHMANIYLEENNKAKSRLAWANLKRICEMNPHDMVVPLSDQLTYQTLETLAEKNIEELS